MSATLATGAAPVYCSNKDSSDIVCKNTHSPANGQVPILFVTSSIVPHPNYKVSLTTKYRSPPYRPQLRRTAHENHSKCKCGSKKHEMYGKNVRIGNQNSLEGMFSAIAASRRKKTVGPGGELDG